VIGVTKPGQSPFKPGRKTQIKCTQVACNVAYNSFMAAQWNRKLKLLRYKDDPISFLP